MAKRFPTNCSLCRLPACSKCQKDAKRVLGTEEEIRCIGYRGKNWWEYNWISEEDARFAMDCALAGL